MSYAADISSPDDVVLGGGGAMDHLMAIASESLVQMTAVSSK